MSILLGSFCRALGALLLFLLLQRSRYKSCCQADSLLRPYPCVTAILLVSLFRLCWEIQKTFLQGVGLAATWTGCRYNIIRHAVDTCNKKNWSKISQGDKEIAMTRSHHLQNHQFSGGLSCSPGLQWFMPPFWMDWYCLSWGDFVLYCDDQVSHSFEQCTL